MTGFGDPRLGPLLRSISRFWIGSSTAVQLLGHLPHVEGAWLDGSRQIRTVFFFLPGFKGELSRNPNPVLDMLDPESCKEIQRPLLFLAGIVPY